MYVRNGTYIIVNVKCQTSLISKNEY